MRLRVRLASSRGDVLKVSLRKLLHLTMSLALLLPYLAEVEGLDALTYYALLSIIAAAVNSFIVKRPLLSVKLKESFEKRRRRVLEALSKTSPAILDLNAKLLKLEGLIQEQIRQIEREYERKGGYIGIVHGLVGVLSSQIIFGNDTFYGVLALAVVDPVAAVVGTLIGRFRVESLGISLEGSLSSLIAFYAVLSLTTRVAPHQALAISITATLAEAVSIEDNLTLPLVASMAAYLVNAPLVRL